MQLCCELNLPDYGFLAIDYESAFQNVSRAALFAELHTVEVFSPLWRYLHYQYDNSSPVFLFSSDNNFVHSFESREGPKQGDIFGSLLFCLGFRPLLRSLADSDPLLLIFAIIDDLFIYGPHLSLARAAKYLNDNSKTISGLTINPTKTILFSPNPLHSSPPPVFSTIKQFLPTISYEFGSMKALGSIIGLEDSQKSSFFSSSVSSSLSQFQKLLHPSSHSSLPFSIFSKYSLSTSYYSYVQVYVRYLPPS